MKTNFIIAGIWALVTAGGCMNLDLTKEIDPFDSETSTDSMEENGTGIWSPEHTVFGGNVSSFGDRDSVGSETDSSTDSDGATEGEPQPDPNDTEPPNLLVPQCEPAETSDGKFCVLMGPEVAAVRFITDEPSQVEIVAHGGDSAIVMRTGYELSHAALVRSLSAVEDSPLEFRISDVNGNSETAAIKVRGGTGPTVAITEVLADPLGVEPTQEFVEIFNYGRAAVELSGWMIDDEGDVNGDVIPEGSWLMPGEAGLLVSEKFSAVGGLDPVPPEGTALFFIGSSIGSSGLKNSVAETLELYDQNGVLVSRYPGITGPPKSGCSDEKLLAELPEALEGIWVYNSEAVSTPGIVPMMAPVVAAP